MAVRPIAASIFVLGNPLRASIITRYGACLVLTPEIPISTGNWVDMMMMLADVMNAEMGMYGMNSMIQPSRRRAKKRSIAPATKDVVFAMSSFV